MFITLGENSPVKHCKNGARLTTVVGLLRYYAGLEFTMHSISRVIT